MSNEKIIKLPIIVCGKVYYANDGGETVEIAYESGVKVVFPKLSEEHIRIIKQQDKNLLHDLHFQDIICSLKKVGEFWSHSNSEHPLYREAITNLCAINGYGTKMAEREMNIINQYCTLSNALYDMLDAELGSRFYLEEWLPREDGLVHAQPQGKVLNVLVGNVPVTSILSLIRILLTKNCIISKLPKRDPITALYFLLSFFEVIKDNPILNALSICYWPGGDAVEETLLSFSDAVCVWGGGKAVKSIKSKAVNCAEIIEYGPKTSFSVVGKESANSKKVAIDLAHDISTYNQEACFSPQFVLVEGSTDVFIQNLREALELYMKLLPKGNVYFDTHAQITRSRLEGLFNGNRVVSSNDGTDWTIVEIKNKNEINEHPLSRFIYVIRVDDIKECIKFVDSNTQTITLSPWNRNVEIRDAATLRGACKITEIGLAESQRVGVPHDHMFPLHKLVKWVAVERGLDYLGKNIYDGPVDTTKWLMYDANMLEKI